MNPLNLIPGFSFLRLGVVAAVLVAIAAGVWKIRHTGVVAGRAEVMQAWADEREQAAADTAANLEAAKKTTTDLQVKADKERGTLNAHIRSIDLERDELLRRLRARPARPAESTGGVPPDTGPGPAQPGCTGAGLYRDDGEVLAGFARNTAALQAGLRACYSQYEAAKKAVNGVK